MRLQKTTIVIWTEYGTKDVDIMELAQEASTGDAYCSTVKREWIEDLEGDPDWDGTEFFDIEEEDNDGV